MIYLGNGMYSDAGNYLQHHGVKGQKWGVRNGPPYPLTDNKVNESNKQKINGIFETMNYKDKRLIFPDYKRGDKFYGDKEYTNKGTIYSVVQKVNGKPAGFITVAKVPAEKGVAGTKSAEIAIGVANGEYRGKGLANRMTAKMVDWFDKQNSIDTLWWLPDESNEKSIKTALKNGFVKDELGDGYVLTKQSVNALKISDAISKKVKNDAKKPVGNQNCMLSTWCAEASFRGRNMLPRAVYSPRDPIFKINEKDIVKNAKVHKISGKKTINNLIKDSPYNSRFYVHVNWAGSSGGHEFLVVNDVGIPRVLDAQSGTYASINDKDGSYYFDGINPKTSYAFRIDNKPLNEKCIKLNQDNYIVDWNESKDIPYMKKHNML